MSTDAIISQALSTGALANTDGIAAQSLRLAAGRDPEAARSFASRARTPIERVELSLKIASPGVTLDQARSMSRRMGCVDPDAQLIRQFGS